MKSFLLCLFTAFALQTLAAAEDSRVAPTQNLRWKTGDTWQIIFTQTAAKARVASPDIDKASPPKKIETHYQFTVESPAGIKHDPCFKLRITLLQINGRTPESGKDFALLYLRNKNYTLARYESFSLENGAIIESRDFGKAEPWWLLDMLFLPLAIPDLSLPDIAPSSPSAQRASRICFSTPASQRSETIANAINPSAPAIRIISMYPTQTTLLAYTKVRLILPADAKWYPLMQIYQGDSLAVTARLVSVNGSPIDEIALTPGIIEAFEGLEKIEARRAD